MHSIFTVFSITFLLQYVPHFGVKND